VPDKLGSRPSLCRSKPSRIFCPVTTFPRLSSGDWLPRECVGVWSGSRVFRCRALEARTLILTYTCSSGGDAGRPRGTCRAELSTLPARPTTEYDRKLEIQFWFGISKMAFRLFGVLTRLRPGGHEKGRRNLLISYGLLKISYVFSLLGFWVQVALIVCTGPCNVLL